MPYPHKMPEFVEFLTKSVPRLNAQEIPTADICDAPLVCVSVNEQWASHIMGALDVLKWHDAWLGTRNEQQAAVDAIERVIEMFTILCRDDSQMALYVQNNIIYQQMLISIYDGDITNVDPDAPDTDFDADSDDSGSDSANRDAALCVTCQILIAQLCEEAIANIKGFADFGAWLIGVAATLFSGNPIVGFVTIAIIKALNGLSTAVLEDEEARKIVACCMYDYLKGKANTAGNFALSLSECDTGSNINAGLILSCFTDGDLGEQGNWLAFNKALAKNFRYSKLDLLDPCPCNCTVYDWNWAADPLLTIADWTALTLAEFPIGPQTTNNPMTDGYQFTLGSASGANYIIGEGYLPLASPSTPTGGKVDVDNNGCFLVEVAITISQNLSANSSGVNVWALADGVWTFLGGTAGFGPTQQRRNVIVAVADVTKVAIIANSANTNYIGRVEITFGS